MFKFRNGDLQASPKTKSRRTLRRLLGNVRMSILALVTAISMFMGAAVIPAAELFVSSFGRNEVLRYNGDTGAFVDAFVQGVSDRLDDPTGLVFGPDGNLYVSSFGTDQVLRFDGTTGAFLDAFVRAGGGGLDNPIGLVFGPDGNLYVSSRGTEQVLRFDGTTGAFLDAFVRAGSGGLDDPTFLIWRPRRSSSRSG
jgi:DNA-binding beta-propeller fold protein YncE